MTISEWFYRTGAKVYATLVKEDIPHVFRSHVFVWRVTGLWSTGDDSRRYKLLTAIFFLGVGLIYPFSQFVNMFFNKTIEQAMDSLFISLTFWATTCKAAVFYMRRDHIGELFRIHNDLLRNARCNVDIELSTTRTSIRIQTAMSTLLFLAWFFAVSQSVFTDPKEAMLPSTAFWPYDFAQQRAVYWAVLIVQLVFSAIYILWLIVTDAFYIASIITAGEHVTRLKERLMAAGSTFDDEVDDRDARFFRDVIECCEQYETCLSYVDALDQILSPSFFVQFGASGLQLCSSVYTVSVLKPADNPMKFMCVIFYFMSTLVELFIFSYFGSRLTTESDDLTHSIYSSQWMDRNEKCKRAQRILVERSMRPMVIYAGGLFELALPTFVRICRAAYSYFNVLRTMDAN